MTRWPEITVFIGPAKSNDRLLAYLQCKVGGVTVYNRLTGVLHMQAFVLHEDFDSATLDRGEDAIFQEMTRTINQHGELVIDGSLGAYAAELTLNGSGTEFCIHPRAVRRMFGCPSPQRG